MVDNFIKAVSNNLSDIHGRGLPNQWVKVVIDFNPNWHTVLVSPPSMKDVVNQYNAEIICKVKLQDTNDFKELEEVASIFNGYTFSDKIPNSGFFLAEHQTLLLFTKNYEEKIKHAYISNDFREIKTDILTYQVFTNMLLNSYRHNFFKNYIDTGKLKGISRTELKFYLQTEIPAMIVFDKHKLSHNDGIDYTLINLMDKVSNELSTKITALSESVVMHHSVYYMGGRVHGKSSAECQTLYVPKIVLIKNGFEDLNDMFKKFYSMLKEEYNNV